MAEQNSTNPLMAALRLPGETYRLPSQGLFYTDTTTLDSSVHNGEVEVYPMTAIDEIIINSPDKLLSGKAITEVFQHCIPQIADASQLLAKDVDFLMVCLRLVSFGQFMEVIYTHDCDDAKEHTYSIDLLDIVRKSKSIDPTTMQQEYKCTLANGQVVSLTPMNYGDVVRLYQNTMTLKTETMSEQEAEDMVVSTMLCMIKDVNGITDKAMIGEWIRGLKLGWKRDIQKAMQDISDWGIEMKSTQKCRDCGKEIEMRVSANPINFFM